jgi:sarcosine oxidase
MPHDILSAADMRLRYPLFKLAENEIAVYEANAGVLQAELCVASFIALAQKYGAELHFEEPMLDWAAVGAGDAGVPAGLPRGVRVRTARGTYYAKKLVLSVGAWAPTVYGSVIPQMRLYIERRALLWFRSSEKAVEDFKVALVLRMCVINTHFTWS